MRLFYALREMQAHSISCFVIYIYLVWIAPWRLLCYLIPLS